MTPGARSDRYEPLPGLLEIPGFVVRKIPPRARRPAAVAAALLLAAAAVALAIGIPAITESKSDRAAADARARAEHRARRAAELESQLRLRSGSGPAARGLAPAAALRAREALAAGLSAAILDDAHSRVRSGEFNQSVSRVECERFPRAVDGHDPVADLSRKRARYSCLAITAETPRGARNNPGVVGYPYRALVSFEAGRYSFCKIAGRPGEGGLSRELPVRIPRACGGT